MSFPIEPPIEPMLAALGSEIPEGDGWIYEPKWDGFRALIFRAGDHVHIASRNQLPLERYFPEIVVAAREALPRRCVVDGEIVIAGARGLDFDALQLRLHPAESRVAKLSREIPATFVAFDLLADDDDLRTIAFGERRARLRRGLTSTEHVFVTPQTSDPNEARAWFERFEGAGLDGVIAKRDDMAYIEGKRVMVKIKHQRTADCVVGGYRLAKEKDRVGSLLLGLYDEEGVLHNVGFTSSFKAAQRKAMLETLGPYEGGSSFGAGRTPGGPSRWNAGKDTAYVSLRPELVCEVAFDHLQGDRFRHGARFLRWRPDKDARECTYEQLRPPRPFSLEEIRSLATRADAVRSASRTTSSTDG